jgi:hypothetical protein
MRERRGGEAMDFVIGVVLALGVGFGSTWIGFDRDRAMYPVVMIVIAAYYVLFACMAGSWQALAAELPIAAAFIAASVAGFRWTLWIVAAALVAHGVYDVVHGDFIANPGVPSFWPPFCAAYDGVAGAYLAWMLARGRIRDRVAAGVGRAGI